MSDMMVELHAKDCTCRGALWMLPQGSASNCEKTSNPVVISVDQWRTLGKPRSVESHDAAAQRAAARVRR